MQGGHEMAGHGVVDVAPNGSRSGASIGSAVREEAVQEDGRELNTRQSDAVLVNACGDVRAPHQRSVVLRHRRLRHVHHGLPSRRLHPDPYCIPPPNILNPNPEKKLEKNRQLAR